MNVVQLPETITSLLYVSRSQPELAAKPGEVEQIVNLARTRNAERGITGAIIFTEAHFAQVIEGRKSAVDELMRSLRADKRHRDIAIVAVETIRERRFPQWAMAYSGPSFYVDRHVKPLLANGGDADHRLVLARKMMDLLREFSAKTV